MKIFIDNGHGIETPGKRSPDGKFLEYQYNRIIASRVTAELLDCGYDAQLLVPEISDISLAERCRRANAVCDDIGTSNVILVSIHVNASGSDGKWHSASGWSAYTTPGISQADLLAYDLYEAAKKYLVGQKIRLFNGPKEPDFESNLYLLKHTKCAAVLTENMFQDCRKDVEFLQNRAGKEAITMLHVEGIKEFLLSDI
ncbi:MAG: N-acetylmuramoyl-L-alanine amidase [Bacteroidales bacterium]|nr:N-acetylmuramoyl-L-alanine amidase [Candidatus Cacconaster equi]